MEALEVSDVKTKTDVHRILAQKCIFNGYNVAITTFILGITTLPYAVSRINFLPRIQKEYKVCGSVFLTVGAAYSSAIYVKNWCQRKIIRELEEMNLGHLVEGIEL